MELLPLITFAAGLLVGWGIARYRSARKAGKSKQQALLAIIMPGGGGGPGPNDP